MKGRKNPSFSGSERERPLHDTSYNYVIIYLFLEIAQNRTKATLREGLRKGSIKIRKKQNKTKQREK